MSDLINESGFTTEQEQFLQSLETATPEETDAVINAYREEVFPEHPDYTPSSKIEEPAASQAAPSTETTSPEASVTTDQPAPVEPVKPIDLTVDADKLFQADNYGLVKIDEQLLAKLNDKDRNALQGILGSRLTPQVLKNYISQSRYIEELKAPKQEVIAPAVPEQVKQAEPVKQNLPTSVAPELAETRDSVLIQKITESIPELNDVKNIRELNQKISDINFSNPLQAAELISKVQGLKQSVDSEVSLMNDFRNNYDKYNTNALDKAIQMIQDASVKNGIDLKEIGLDINEVNETGESKVLKSLLYLPDGTPNPAVVKFGAPGTLVDGIPIISEQDVFNAFLQLATPKALAYTAQKNAELLQQQQRIIAEAKAKGFEEGHKAIAHVINSQPVISDGTGVGSQAATINYADMTPEQAANLTPSQAAKFLEFKRAQLG